MAYNVPPIPGLGTTGGLEMELQDLGGQTPQDLAAALGSLIYNANGTGEIAAAFSTFPRRFTDAVRGYRPPQGGNPGNPDRRYLHHAPGQSGFVVCE